MMNNEHINNENPQPGTMPDVEQAAPGCKPYTEKTRKATPQKKELTPAQQQQRRRMLIMPLFFLIFAAAMWFIFSPSREDKEKESQGIGLNADLPVPNDEGMIGDKRNAYQREAMQAKEQEKMRSLQDFSFQLGEAGMQSKEGFSSGLPDHDHSAPRIENASSRNTSSSAVQSSVAAYQDIKGQLGTWYDQPAVPQEDQALLALEWRLQELERRNDEQAERKRLADEQLELMEKSYQMAARYMPQPQNAPLQTLAGETGTGSSDSRKVIVHPVHQVRQSVVTLLATPVEDQEVVLAYSTPRNLAFLTAAGNEGVQDRNCIRAVVHQTTTLTSGKELQMRLTEPMRAGDILIPAHSILTGACRLGSERLDVTVSSIEYAGNIIPVELIVYDADGQRGLFIPHNDEVKSLKEIAASLSNSAGSSIMISDNAGSQLAADMGKGLIQGTSQYVSKKMQSVKVTLKAGYRVLLLPKTQ